MKNIQLKKHKNNSKTQRLRSKRLAHYKHLRNTTKTVKLQSKKKAVKNQTKQSQKSKTQTKLKVTRPKGSTKSKTHQQLEKKIKKHEIQEQQQELKTHILLLNKNRYQTHMDKYRNLTSIGVPTIKFDQNILKNYINQQKEINENLVQKLIGIIGEGFIELPNDSIINLEQKQLIIQKKVNQLLLNCSVDLGWNLDRWLRLIGKTVIPIQYPNMEGVEINQSLNTKERYRLMFQTVNLFHLQNTIGEDVQHNFSRNLPLQTVDDIDLSDLINSNDLGNVRILRKYLSGILQILKKISKFDPLQDVPQSMKELYKQQNLLQDLCVEYYISKMKPIKLKFFRPKIQYIDDFQVQIEEVQKESSNQKELKVKKSINLNGKPRTLLEFFKPVRKNVSLNQNNEALNSPLPRNIIQKQDSPNYFEILEGYIKDFYIESNKSLKTSEEGK